VFEKREKNMKILVTLVNMYFIDLIFLLDKRTDS